MSAISLRGWDLSAVALSNRASQKGEKVRDVKKRICHFGQFTGSLDSGSTQSSSKFDSITLKPIEPKIFV